MLIDCYGYLVTSQFYQNKKKSVYETNKIGVYTYIRFSTSDVGPIHRLDETDPEDQKMSWVYGSWNNRASLTYETDLNTSIDIEISTSSSAVAAFRMAFGKVFQNTEEYPDEYIQSQLDNCALEVQECVFKKYYRKALHCLTAHQLFLYHEQQAAMVLDPSGSSSGNPKGVVSSATVGDLSFTQELPEYSVSSDDRFLASTVWGQEFIRLRNKMSRGPLLGHTPVLSTCPRIVNAPTPPLGYTGWW